MLQILTIAAVSSLQNVIKLETITKVQVFNHATDTSFNVDVYIFRSIRPRSEIFTSKTIGAEVSMIRELINVVFYKLMFQGVTFYSRARPCVEFCR